MVHAFSGSTENCVPKMCAAMATFVVDWNMGSRTPSGEDVPADPPAEAGGGQFLKFLPKRIVEQIYIDLRILSRGLGKAKSSTPLVSMVDTTGAANSTLTEPDA